VLDGAKRPTAVTSTLKMEATCSSETSVYIKPTWRHILEDGIPHSHRSETLKYCHLFVREIRRFRTGGCATVQSARPLPALRRTVAYSLRALQTAAAGFSNTPTIYRIARQQNTNTHIYMKNLQYAHNTNKYIL
jgi:hypothetical protein